jgi:hypothetical protein
VFTVVFAVVVVDRVVVVVVVCRTVLLVVVGELVVVTVDPPQAVIKREITIITIMDKLISFFILYLHIKHFE